MKASENTKIIQVLALVAIHLFCFEGSCLVISSFAYMLTDINSIKSFFVVIALHM